MLAPEITTGDPLTVRVTAPPGCRVEEPTTGTKAGGSDGELDGRSAGGLAGGPEGGLEVGSGVGSDGWLDSGLDCGSAGDVGDGDGRSETGSAVGPLVAVGEECGAAVVEGGIISAAGASV